MYNAAVWLAKVREVTGKDIEIDWQPFSLAQVNSDNHGSDVKLWDQPEHLDGTDPTFLAHRAGLSAKRQGKEAFESFFITLLKARHEDRVHLSDPAIMEDVASKAGLDLAQFREDLADPDLLRELAESHTRAVEEYGAFGSAHLCIPQWQISVSQDVHPPRGAVRGDLRVAG